MMQPMSDSSVRFRRSLPAEPVEADGYIFYELARAEGEAFRLYDFEYKVAMELDGRPFSDVLVAVAERHNLALSEDQLRAFADELGTLGLLEGEPDAPNEFDPMEDAPTAGHGLAALRFAVDDVAPKAPAPVPGASGWHQAEPTALMNSMSDLLAVSRARTGENPVMEEAEADAPDFDQPANPRESGAPLPPATWPEASGQESAAEPSMRTEETTQDLKAAAARVPRPEPADPSLEWAAGLGITLPETAKAPTTERKWWLWALIATVLASAVGYAVYRFVIAPADTAVSVDTVVPSPSAVYRWFGTVGEMQPPAPATLVLPAGGKVVHVREAGSKFRAGDVLANTDEGKRQEGEIDHLRERIAYYQQMLEAMTAEGNKPEVRQAEIKLGEKRRLLDEAMAAFAQVAIVAATDGEVDAVAVKAGDTAKPGDVVLTLKAHQARAVFKLSHDDADQAQRLAFCRVLLADAPADCEFVGTDAEDTVVVELPVGTVGNPGQAVQLARARFDGVFPVPNSAVVQIGNTERLFVAAPSGRVQVRAIAVADKTDQETLVAQGIDVGDAVIVNASTSLTAATRVHVTKRVLQ